VCGNGGNRRRKRKSGLSVVVTVLTSTHRGTRTPAEGEIANEDTIAIPRTQGAATGWVKIWGGFRSKKHRRGGGRTVPDWAQWKPATKYNRARGGG